MESYVTTSRTKVIESYNRKISFSNPNILKSAFLILISYDSKSCRPIYFKLRILLDQEYRFEISKIYDIGFNRYRDYKIRVCGKDSIPLMNLNCLSYSKWVYLLQVNTLKWRQERNTIRSIVSLQRKSHNTVLKQNYTFTKK